MDFKVLQSPLSVGIAGEGICAEYDVAYLGLDQLATGIPTSIMGNSVLEGKEPDWQKLRQNCLQLWDKTRDLRVATYLTVASLCIEGLEGFRNGLEIIKYLVDNHWENFWPNLDPLDNNDPTERINILSMLSPRQGSYSDPLMFISRFRDVKLLEDKNYSLRDYMDISNELDSDGSGINIQSFNAEMSAVPSEIMRNRLAIAKEIVEILQYIADTMNSKISGSGMVSFESLNHELKVLVKFYSSYALVEQHEPEDVENSTWEDAAHGKNSDTVKTPLIFNLNTYSPMNRNEALILLRKSADYFRKTEPTNPIPYILDRALRIAGMNFVDILNDISPESLDRVKDQLGILKDNQSK